MTLVRDDRPRRDNPRETSTPFPEPDRFGEADQRRVYTAEFDWILCRMRQPFATDRFTMPARPRG